LAPDPTQIAPCNAEHLVDGFPCGLAGITHDDSTAVRHLGGQLATDAVPVKWIELFMNDGSRFKVFARETGRELRRFGLDVAADITV
jgi:hypothetical protein